MKKESPIFDLFKRKMGAPVTIVDDAFNTLPAECKKPDYLKNNFSSLIDRLEETAHKLYRERETKFGTEALLRYFGVADGLVPVTQDFRGSMENSFSKLNAFFLSIAQSRKARAGKAFEMIIKRLFKALDYPFEEQVVINGKPDFLLPSSRHYRKHAADCIIFTAKRTLRERWRQIVTEGIRGLAFFLATIDKQVTDNALKEMNSNRIFLVVSGETKSIARYKREPNVITFEAFFKHHLDPAMRRWKDNKII